MRNVKLFFLLIFFTASIAFGMEIDQNIEVQPLSDFNEIRRRPCFSEVYSFFKEKRFLIGYIFFPICSCSSALTVLCVRGGYEFGKMAVVKNFQQVNQTNEVITKELLDRVSKNETLSDFCKKLL